MTHTDKGNYAAKHHGNEPPNDAVVLALKKKAENGKISCAAAHAIARDCSVSPAETGREIDREEIQITHCQLGIFRHSGDKQLTPEEIELAPELNKALAAELVDGRLACKTAWLIAERFSLTRPQLGAACNRLGIKINACQLGTFR